MVGWKRAIYSLFGIEYDTPPSRKSLRAREDMLIQIRGSTVKLMPLAIPEEHKTEVTPMFYKKEDDGFTSIKIGSRKRKKRKKRKRNCFYAE